MRGVFRSMFRAKVSSKGQLVIPKPLREAFQLREGGEVLLVPTEEGLLVKQAAGLERPIRGLLRELVLDDAECEAILNEAKMGLLKGLV